VEFNQQIYRAPSIPKLGRRNVSSSVLSSASKISAASPTPKLKVSRAKFTGRQEPIAEAVVSNAQALTETNLILVEIQKQLSLDFAMRIAEERETIKRMKAAESRRRFGAEEKAVEGTGKLGKGIGKVFNKVISPAKSIFGRIIDFFSIILTGIVFNNAFKWLQDKNNREKVLGVINWVTKHWKELLGVFIGVKVFGFLYKLIGFAKFVSGFFGGRGRGRGPGGRGPRGGGPYDPRGPLGSCGPVFKCLDKIKGRQLEALADKLAKTKRFSPLFSQSPGSETTSGKTPWWNNALTILGTVIDVASLISLFAPVPGGRPISVLLKALRGSLIFKGLRKGTQAANRTGNTIKRTIRVVQDTSQKAKQNRSGYALETIEKSGTGRRQTYEQLSTRERRMQSAAQDVLERQKARNRPDVTEGVFDEVRPDGGGRRFNRGGIIPGPRVNKDVTPIMGTPGERVVPLSARGFFPFVDDIIFNGGKMWEMFSGAIKKLFLVTRRQEETSRKFGEVTDKLNKNLKVERQRAAIESLTGGKGGGSRASSFNVRPKASPTPSYYNLGRSAGGGMTFLPMVLPTKQSAPPTIPTPQAPATEVPFISPMNVADPYRQLTPEIYGIFV
jgi:hypothetical protein